MKLLAPMFRLWACLAGREPVATALPGAPLSPWGRRAPFNSLSLTIIPLWSGRAAARLRQVLRGEAGGPCRRPPAHLQGAKP